MSRIGKKPVALPAGVEVKVNGNVVTVKGPKGELSDTISSLMEVKMENGVLTVENPKPDDRVYSAQHGLARTLINNMVVGVTQGYTRKLTMTGVGYRAEKKGNTLVLSLGYSHPIEMPDPKGITTEVPTQTEIIVKGTNKAEVGNYAAIIRSKRGPEPYKGKGIVYEGERIRRKEGKAGVKK
ncbi:MAG: 50S ribosomal protein L6 [Lachnospiraceae bacterium]|nr:50S ribosomal protein L6 [Lachnospiraceae bacterium]